METQRLTLYDSLEKSYHLCCTWLHYPYLNEASSQTYISPMVTNDDPHPYTTLCFVQWCVAINPDPTFRGFYLASMLLLLLSQFGFITHLSLHIVHNCHCNYANYLVWVGELPLHVSICYDETKFVGLLPQKSWTPPCHIFCSTNTIVLWKTLSLAPQTSIAP
jgi:hypothetical protein